MACEYTETATLQDGGASIDVAVKATPMASDGSVAGLIVTLVGGSVLGVGTYAPALGYGMPCKMLDAAAAWACDIAHGSAAMWSGRVSPPDTRSDAARALTRAARVTLLRGGFMPAAVSAR